MAPPRRVGNVRRELDATAPDVRPCSLEASPQTRPVRRDT
jgi:hypothetical protein